MDEIDRAFLFILIGHFSLLLWAGIKIWACRMRIKKLDRDFTRVANKYRREREKEMSKEYFGIGKWEDHK